MKKKEIPTRETERSESSVRVVLEYGNTHRTECRADGLNAVNLKVKQSMANELMSMGLTREAIRRILRMDVIEDKGERLKAKEGGRCGTR